MAWIVAGAALAAGFLIPTGTLSDSSAALVVTFLGLVAAGILPAMSLLVGNALSGSLSVAKLVALKAEIDGLLGKMYLLLAVLAVGVVFSVVHQLDVDLIIPDFGGYVFPNWVRELPERCIQASVFCSFIVTLDRTRLVVLAFKLVLKARYELALADSRKRLTERAPSDAEMATTFQTSDGFGTRVSLNLTGK